jgi:ABC-type nitrate/sulfonate/bicarbonate transport system permease component
MKGRERLLSILSPLLLLAVWEVAVRAGLVDRRFIAAPSIILVALWDMLASGELARHVGISLWRIAAGFGIGVVPAVLLGLWMGLSRPVRAVIDPLIAAVYPIPKIAILPLLMVFFGIGESSKIAVVAISAFFPIVINTYAGVANIERVYLDVAQSFGASRALVFRRVVFPGALPVIFAGIRLALGVCLIVIVSAEFVAARSGIGFLIWSSWEMLLIDKMFVGLLVIAVIGTLLTILLREIQRWAIPWRSE